MNTRCMCPDDCNCRHPYRTNYCGCINHPRSKMLPGREDLEPYCNHDAVAVIDGVCECGHKVTAIRGGELNPAEWRTHDQDA